MFRIHRHKSDRCAAKFDFRFSCLSASQIPKGWDLLVVSFISLQTGKIVAKSNKAAVSKGSCKWSESFKETIWVDQHDALKETMEGHLKIVISTGTLRSGILGEAILNLTGYVNTDEATNLSLPLTKCTFGTILELQIQAFTARTGFRDGLRKHLREFRSYNQNQMADIDNLEGKSDQSDNMFSRSIVLSSSSLLGASGYHEEPAHREPSFSASGSHHSSDSGESFVVKSNVSSRGSMSGPTYNAIARQDSMNSQNSAGNCSGLGDEMCRSNNSSFNSKASTFPWHEGQSSSNSLGIRHVDQSKELFEAAQETIEELRGEARMWERTARKLKSDLDESRKEISDQANHLATLEKELSSTCLEHDKLKCELEQLKISSCESAVRRFTSDSPSSQEDVVHKLKELEEEVQFQKETNATLTRQLNKTQESNYELLSVLQELEETIERQKMEISKISAETTNSAVQYVSGDKSIDFKSEGLFDPTVKESFTVSSPTSCTELGSLAVDNCDLVREVVNLRAKVGELERDCAELIEENIELLHKLKELRQDASKNDSICSHCNLFGCSISCKGSVVLQCHDRVFHTGQGTDDININFEELEKRCVDLEIELQFFKDKAQELAVKLQMSPLELDLKYSETSGIKPMLENREQLQYSITDDVSACKAEKLDAFDIRELSVLLNEMYKELQKPISLLKNPWSRSDVYVVTESESTIVTSCSSLKEKADAILSDIFELDKLVHQNIADCSTLFKNNGTEICIGEPGGLTIGENMNVDIHLNSHNVTSETLYDKLSTVDSVLSPQLKREITALKQEKDQLEVLICQLNIDKVKLERDLETRSREHDISYKSRNDLEHKLTQHANSMETQISVDKKLDTKLLELECRKHELETNLSELEQENIHLSEHTSSLEALLRCMTDEKECYKLEIEKLKSLNGNLKNEVSMLSAQLEEQKVELKQKLQDALNRLRETKEESDFLNKACSKLEDTIECMTDKSRSLQKYNEDLERQNLDLHGKCTFLELELTKSYEKKIEFMEKLDTLESKIVSIQEETALQEKIVNSQLDGLLNASKQSEETVIVDVDHMQKLIDGNKCKEERLKRIVDDLERKLKSSEDENKLLQAEISSMKLELKRIPELQEEILFLKSSVDSVRIEKSKVEKALQLLTSECDELRVDKKLYEDKIATMKKAQFVSEDARLSKPALEEKHLPLECDLTPREALSAYDAELKNDLNCFRRTNTQNEQKIHCLEVGKDELEQKVQDLMEVSELKTDEKQFPYYEENSMKVGGRSNNGTEGTDVMSRIQKLESELAEALHTSDTYRKKLQDFQAVQDDTSMNYSECAEDGSHSRFALLEAEMKDLRERYSEMSLRYAEVEAERQELVLKLKSFKSPKKWF